MIGAIQGLNQDLEGIGRKDQVFVMSGLLMIVVNKPHSQLDTVSNPNELLIWFHTQCKNYRTRCSLRWGTFPRLSTAFVNQVKMIVSEEVVIGPRSSPCTGVALLICHLASTWSRIGATSFVVQSLDLLPKLVDPTIVEIQSELLWIGFSWVCWQAVQSTCKIF
jgi:hypothetical protein